MHSLNLLNNKRMELLEKQLQSSGYLSVFVSSVFAWIMYGNNNTQHMIIWVVINASIILLRMPLFKKLRDRHKHKKLEHFTYYFILLFFILVSGVYWGIGLYLFTPEASNQELFFTIIISMTIMVVVSVPGLAVSIPACLMMIIPIYIGLSARLYEYDFHILFYTLMASYLFLIATAVRLNKVIIQSLGLDIENEKLLASITIEKEIAEQANIEKSQFLAAASHDLRQPLNSMGLFLYSLRKTLNIKQNEQPEKILTHIDNAYLALKNLFDSLLEISRLDAGTIVSENKQVELSFILKPLTDEMSELAAAKGLDFFYQPVNCKIQTDPIILSRIMRNLISNAIKYTHQGKIKIIEKIESNKVSIEIIDTGIGIPQQEFKNIFNEYHQLANKQRDRRQGIGLGLALVKKMSQLISADISLTSTLNKGSTFTLCLPIVNSMPLKDESPIQVEIEPSNESLDDIKVLVIDDEPDILQAMQLILKGWSCQVELADNHQQASTLITNFTPDIILCDYRLQENMTGIDVINLLRKQLNHNTPCIIISGDTNTELLNTIDKAGFILLSKPIQPSVLHTQIKTLLNKPI